MNSSPDSRDLDTERIFFRNLSEEAKRKALEFKGIKDAREANWDIFPMAFYYEPISNLSQDEIDIEALASIGFYRQ
jgi:hypothetical protein